MAPISIDSGDVSGITIDGQDVQEVTADGDVVWTAVESGSTMYTMENSTVRQFSLSTPYDVSTATEEKTLDVSNEVSDGFLRSMNIADGGSALFVASESTIYKYNLTTPYDIGSANFDSSGTVSNEGAQITDISGIEWADGGNALFVTEQGGPYIAKYSPSTPYEISGLGGEDSNFQFPSTNVFGVDVKPDGSRLYAVENGDTFVQVNLSTPFDPSSGTRQSDDFATLGTHYSIEFHEGGNQYTTAFDDETAQYGDPIAESWDTDTEGVWEIGNGNTAANDFSLTNTTYSIDFNDDL